MVDVLAATLASSLWFLARALPVFALGVVAAEWLVALGWIHRVAWMTRPLTRMGNLNPVCGASFLTAFFSPSAGNSMLVRYHERGVIGKRELFIAAMVNTFPGIVMHWRSMLPVALPLIGVYGLVYYGLLVLVGLIKTVLALVAGRFFLDTGSGGLPLPADSAPSARPSLGAALVESIQKSRQTLGRILSTTIPVTLVMFGLIHAGAFDRLAPVLGSAAGVLPLSAESLSIVITRMGSNVGAFTVAGNLMYAGTVSGREAVLSLLVGNLLASGINLRYLIPYYLGIFGPGLGIRILAVSTGLRMVVMVGVIAALFALWK